MQCSRHRDIKTVDDVRICFVWASLFSQPLMICRQCPGYSTEVSQLLFATGSHYWLHGLPAPPPVPPPPKPATEEGSAKPALEQPSVSSVIPAGKWPKVLSQTACYDPNMSGNSDIKFSILLFRSFHYPSPMLFCSCLVCSSSGVPVPPSGLPSHLHLLPPANARQTSRAQQPEGYLSAVWVQDELVIRQSVLMHCKPSAANYYNSMNTGKSAFVCFCSLHFILFTCMDRSLHHRYTPQVHNALCVGRYAVPASLLSHVLGLPEDWLSRLSCSFQW